MGYRSTSWICCVSLLISSVVVPPAFAAEPKPNEAPAVTRKAPKALDVTIGKDGTISGVLVNAAGKPQQTAKLVARRSNEQAIEINTNEKGEFKLKDAHAGVYSIAYGDRSLLVRAWDAKIAPPSSKPAVLLVHGDVTRGQLADLNPLAGGFTAQAFAVGVLTAAVAVPIAIGLDEPSGS